MPKGIYDRAASAWKPKPKREYPAELVERVRQVYDAGHTMRETAAICGTTVRVLQTLMPRHGIKRRPAVIRDQAGDRNSVWRGSHAGYQALHLRVATERGKPNLCTRCGTSDLVQKYEWANLTGNYADIDDYARMCIPCHRKYDAARRRLTGERTIPPHLGGGSYV